MEFVLTWHARWRFGWFRAGGRDADGPGGGRPPRSPSRRPVDPGEVLRPHHVAGGPLYFPVRLLLPVRRPPGEWLVGSRVRHYGTPFSRIHRFLCFFWGLSDFFFVGAGGAVVVFCHPCTSFC